jgi:hypothetical protein
MFEALLARLISRLVRPIPDVFNFGLANPVFNFGLSEPVCGCTCACVTCVARGSSPGATFDATSESDAHEQPQTELTESEIRSRVCQSDIKIIRNWPAAPVLVPQWQRPCKRRGSIWLTLDRSMDRNLLEPP